MTNNATMNRMKNLKQNMLIVYIVLACFQSTAQSYDTTNFHWLTNLEQATMIASEKNLPILIVFAGSDWCRPCIQLNRQVFEQAEFQSWASENIVPVMFEFPRQKKNALSPQQQAYNDSMAEKYNPKGAFPKVIIADHTGREIGALGFFDIGPKEYIAKIEEIIIKHK